MNNRAIIKTFLVSVLSVSSCAYSSSSYEQDVKELKKYGAALVTIANKTSADVRFYLKAMFTTGRDIQLGYIESVEAGTYDESTIPTLIEKGKEDIQKAQEALVNNNSDAELFSQNLMQFMTELGVLKQPALLSVPFDQESGQIGDIRKNKVLVEVLTEIIQKIK